MLMNICPDCKAPLNPLRLLLARGRYRCGHCRQTSKLSKKQALALGLFNAALIVFFIFAVGRQWHLWQRIGLYLIVSIIAQKLITWLFMRFEPVKTNATL
jgi:hypothetical protein